MPYPFDQIFAADPERPEMVATNAPVVIFAPGDETKTPLTLTALNGLPLENPITVNDRGFGPAFIADLDQVAWEGGGLTGLMASYRGLKDDAEAARQEATLSRVAAEEAARNTVAPTAEVVAEALTAEGPAREAVNAAISAGTANLALKPDNGGKPVGKGELVVNVRDYGAVGNLRGDDTEAVRLAVAEAKRSGGIMFWPNGGYLTTANIPDLHTVRHRGNGFISRDGVSFSPEPTYSRKNILYVAPAGLPTNDGLSPQTPLDVQSALIALGNYGPVLNGHWVIQHAAGVYPGGYSMPYMAGARRPVEIRGVDMGGPRVEPTVIYDRGSSSIAWGFTTTNMPVDIYDIKYVGFNINNAAGGTNSGAIRLDAYTEANLWNIHVDTADFGVYALTNTKYIMKGSYIKNCQLGVSELWHVTRSMAANFETRNIIENCFYGIKAKELCTGHGDWNEYIGCDYAVHMSRNSTINSSYAIFKRNKNVFVMSGSSTFVDLYLTLGTGADKNGVYCRYINGVANMRAGAENYLRSPYIGMTEKTLGYGRKVPAHTGTTADTQLVPLGGFRAGDFTGEGAWVRWEAYGVATTTAAGATLRLRVGGGTGLSVTLPASSNYYTWKFEGRMYVTADGDAQRVDGTFTQSGGQPMIIGADRSFTFSTTPFTFGLYAQLASASDSLSITQSVLFTSDL